MNQLTGYRNFGFGILGKRNTDCIADTISKECTYTYRRLDASIVGISGFSYTKMQWEMHALFIHFLYEQTHSANHNRRVGSLDADDHIGEILFDTNTQELHTRLHHSGRSISITRHDAIAERTMVNA